MTECALKMLVIRKDDDPALRRKAKPVTAIDEKVLTLASEMMKTMYAADGIGLAAPQVGESVRLVVYDIGDGPVTMINPVITKTAGTLKCEERCLSLPGKYAYIERPDYVEVKYVDRAGRPCSVDGDGLLGRCLQHEIDHLDGKLYTDLAEAVYTDPKPKGRKEGAAE